MELYKYTGSVAAMTVRFGKAETITLYDSYDDSVAPVRLDVRGALAEYIKEIEGTCDTAFTLILEAFRLRRANLFYKDGEVSAEWEERK